LIIYVSRDAQNNINGVYLNKQDNATEQIDDQSAQVLAYKASLVINPKAIDVLKAAIVRASSSWAGLSAQQKAQVQTLIDNAALAIIANLS
jgi:hypothetical protein